MFAKLATIASLAILAVATPTSGPSSQCSTGAVQCCQSITKASDPVAAGILAGLGVVVQDVNTPIGLQCSPITVIGGGNGACSAKTVCCQDNSHGNVISVGCVPVTL